MSFFSSLGKAAGGLFGSAASGGMLGLIGGLGSDVFNLFNAKSYRNWMSKMSGSAISRRMKDLKSSGINPVLAGGSGGAASTPQVLPPHVSSPVPRAFAVASAKQQLSFQRAQTALINAQTNSAKANTKLILSNISRTHSDVVGNWLKNTYSAV